MGHTEDIHKLYYQMRSDVIERIEVAKILLIQDYNIVNKYVDKRLSDINFQGILMPFYFYPELLS